MPTVGGHMRGPACAARTREPAPGVAVFNNGSQDHGLENALDNILIEKAGPALTQSKPVIIETEVKNINRTVGAMLSGEVAEKFGHGGLPEDSIVIKAQGSGGQSFGAFLAQGITIELQGDANDYTGKGISGGRLIIYPPPQTTFTPEDNIIIGNVALYGAVGGECFFRGVAGERFCVRNSGATAVIEGVGDHCCEYMTGGVVVVLGSTGRNFAAGMSGGIAYVLDEVGDFDQRCNLAMVDLEPITEEARLLEDMEHQGGDLETHGMVDVMRDMSSYDSLRLHKLIEQHMHLTDSSRAREILENWDDFLPKFVKVMPVEYRRALKEMQARSEDNTTSRVGLALGD